MQESPSIFNKIAGQAIRLATLLNKNFNTGVFLKILRNFYEQRFSRIPLDVVSQRNCCHTLNFMNCYL